MNELPSETTNDGWDIDVDVKQQERKAFVAAGTSGNDDELYPFLTKFIKAWPYPYDPTDIASYDELKFSEFVEVVKRVTAAFQQLAAKFTA